VVRSAGFTKKFGYNNDIWVTDPSGGSGRALANPADDYDPVWSPVGLFDGKNWLAFVSNRGDIAHSENQGAELWVMHPDGTNPLRLTCHGPIFSKHPSWSADAKQLVFYSNYPSGGNSQIFVLDLSGFNPTNDTCEFGNTLKNLSNNGFNDSEPIWIK
jgi:Tol biopolymer transport system component